MRYVTLLTVVCLVACVPGCANPGAEPGSDVTANFDPSKMPPMPKPTKEHNWLAQFAGEWESESTMQAPGQPPQTCKGTESAKMVGGFWLHSHVTMHFMDPPITGLMTLGYDPEKKKYVGTWVDSMGSYLWKYEGSVDSSGKVLTLNTEGPCPHEPGKLMKFREVIELKDADHKVFTSNARGEDGKWTAMMTINSTRKR